MKRILVGLGLVVLGLVACSSGVVGELGETGGGAGPGSVATSETPCATTADCPAQTEACVVWRCLPSSHLCEAFTPDHCADAGADQ